MCVCTQWMSTLYTARGVDVGDKARIPPLFQDYPDHWRAFLRHGKINHGNLSVKLMQKFAIDVIRKAVVEGRRIDFKEKNNLSKDAPEVA